MNETRSPFPFRDDINGLRAIAVIGVVLYHFQLASVGGGFVGVDVFFVISGFLMTQIIAGKMAGGRFSFASFYAARVRRIVPALVVVVGVVTLVGAGLMDPLQLKVLGEDAGASLLFVSNVLYVQQGGYFAVPADQNWLLHTWSLAVEGQFYLIYPLILVTVYRFVSNKVAVVAVLGALALLSLADMLIGSHAGPGGLTLNFYMIWSRAWEFLVGGLCAVAGPLPCPGLGARRLMHGLGLAAILMSMVILQSKTAIWPSILTGVPVAGSASVLVADLGQARWARLAPVRRLGQWSYSIYLWHWPIIAMCSLLGYTAPTVRVVGALVSLVMGFVSYHLIERRAADYLSQDRRHRFWVALPSFAGILALVALTVATNGGESIRFASHPETLAALRDYRAAQSDWTSTDDCATYVQTASGFALCHVGKVTARDTLVIGDSFAQQLIPRYKSDLARGDIGITFLVRSGCLPAPGIERLPFGSNCGPWVDEAFEYANLTGFKRVVFVAFWFSYDRSKTCIVAFQDCGASLDDAAFAAALDGVYRGMAAEWRRLKVQGKDVVVFEETPFGEGDPTDLYRQALLGTPVVALTFPLKDFEARKAATAARLADAARDAGVTLVDPATALCPGGQCPFVAGGRALYKDAFHLRASVMTDARFAVFDRYIAPGAGSRPAINEPAGP